MDPGALPVSLCGYVYMYVYTKSIIASVRRTHTYGQIQQGIGLETVQSIGHNWAWVRVLDCIIKCA